LALTASGASVVALLLSLINFILLTSAALAALCLNATAQPKGEALIYKELCRWFE